MSTSTWQDSTATGVDRVVAVLDALESWLAAGTRGCGFVNAYAELSTSSEGATAVVRAEKQWMRELYGRLLVEIGVEDSVETAGRSRDSSPSSTRAPSSSRRPAVRRTPSTMRARLMRALLEGA